MELSSPPQSPGPAPPYPPPGYLPAEPAPAQPPSYPPRAPGYSEPPPSASQSYLPPGQAYTAPPPAYLPQPQPKPQPLFQASLPPPAAAAPQDSAAKEAGAGAEPHSAAQPDPSTMTPQEQQQYWYQQHLLSLQQRAKAHAQGQQQLKSTGTVKDAPEQRVKQEEGKANATNQQSEAPSLKEPATPAPKEEDPPLSAAESKLNIEPPEDSEEDLRLQQLQVAAAQWQQHPHHRVGFQYQRIMQKHAQLQQILQQYQQIIQQPPHLQTMSVDMQLQHYETQQKQFQQLHKEWEREFQQWQDQLQTYPHKDQLQEYEKQWQTWQGQMKATQSHLQEKVNSLQNMKNQYPGSVTMPPPFASYTQTAQGSIPVMPPTLPPTTPPQVPPPLSSGSQMPNSSIPPTSSSQSPQPTETPRPALLPTPVSFAPKVSGLAATLPYHSQITSSIAPSDQGNSQVHMAKQSGPFASVSSEQGSGELKTSTGTSPLTPTTSITTFTQDKPLRSGGLLPDPPRGPYFEGPRGPRFDGPRGRGFERFEGPRQRGPRFEGQHLEGPKPRYENQKSDRQSSSKWGTIPRGPASQFYTTPTTSQMHSTRPSGPQCRGPRPSFGQQQLQAESRTENKEPFTDAAGKQQMANRTQSTPIPIDTDAKNSGPVQPNEDLKKMQQEPPKSEVKEVISEPKKWTWSSQDPAQQAEESKPTTQPPPAQSQKLASVPSSSAILQSPVPSRTGETAIVTPSPVPGDKDLNSADNKLPVSDGTLGQDLPGSENRVKGTVMSEGNRGTGPVSRGRGQGRMEDGRGRGQGRMEDGRGRGQGRMEEGRGRGQGRMEEGRGRGMGRMEEGRGRGYGRMDDGRGRGMGRMDDGCGRGYSRIYDGCGRGMGRMDDGHGAGMGRMDDSCGRGLGRMDDGQGRMDYGHGRGLGRIDSVSGRGQANRGMGQAAIRGRGMAMAADSWDKLSDRYASSQEGLSDERSDSRERLPDGHLGSRERGFIGRSDSQERVLSSRDRELAGRPGNKDRGQAASREQGPVRQTGSHEREPVRQADSHERGPFRREGSRDGGPMRWAGGRDGEPMRRAGSGDGGPVRQTGSRERGLVRRAGSWEREPGRSEMGGMDKRLGDSSEKFPPYHREEPLRGPWSHEEERMQEELPLDSRDAPLDCELVDDWERDRYWREHDTDFRDDSLDPYDRDDRFSLHHSMPPLSPLPPLPPLSSDFDRRDPWWDDWERPREREVDRDLDRIGRSMDSYDCDLDREWDGDYLMPPDDREIPSRDLDIPPLPPMQSFPPLDRYHEDRWREERDRDLYDRDRRDRGELRIREYPERVDRWREKRNYPPERTDWERERLSERWYADEEERMQPLEDQLDLPIPPPRSSDMLEADSAMDTDQSLGGVMVLSQRQHEIILKAAQELKMLREQKEQMQKLKEFVPEPELPTHETSRSQTTTPRPGSYQVSSQHPSETSLESQPITSSPAVIIKPPVLFRQPTAVTRPTSTVTRSSASVSRPLSSSPTPIASSSQTPGLKPSLATVEQERWDEDSFHGLWDTNEDKGANLEYELCKSDSGLPPPASSSVHPSLLSSVSTSLSSVMPSISKPPLIQQTVDYGHGRDITTSKVEQIPYGERITLRPEPLPERQPFPKEHPGQRDRYNRERDREPYFERQGNSSIDHRDFKREREVHRDRSSGDYDRERFEKERHPREDRVPPTVPSRTQSYRDKKDHPSTRRGSFERPSYERKPDRSTYDHGPSMFGGDRRNYPEERMPISAPSVPRQPPPTPRVERKPESKNVDDILKLPGRDSRPERIVIIMRGLPGSGKTHVAKLIRDKEVDCGGPAPRVLSLDDYFITEVEKEERDPDTGKKVKKKVMEYEYEADMEETYRTSMFKTFKKTLDDGFFPFIILDAINDRVRHFEQFWSAAKTKGFEVYLAEMSADNQTCSKRNIHGRKLKEINRMSDHWETAPRHMMRLDIRSLLQDAAIEEVEMEDFDANIEDQKEENKKDAAEEEESELGYIPKSKWEMDTSEAKLDKLDGLRTGAKRKRDWEAIASRMEDYLQLPDDYDTRASEPGKKRVRWADLEEKKDADRKRAIGFVVGQTDWEKITDESGHLAERALNRTKYI
ncbi:YLP motif-containing protein 1 isoform X1 [Alligator sinensis]|uniref:YLP motif-containing protein 1 n=1 Tax=Alligator sinensis TaxID=38654 RepID=A0A3Q0GAL8_ALLSI|nr:YLP motif-containing protein 1 isoform X1 [Alligator sinensis]